MRPLAPNVNGREASKRISHGSPQSKSDSAGVRRSRSSLPRGRDPRGDAGFDPAFRGDQLSRLAGHVGPRFLGRWVGGGRCVRHVDRLTRLGPATRDSYVAGLDDGTERPVSRRGCARLNELL